MNNYKALVVWQKLKYLVLAVYQITKRMPKEETYALSNQMRRAAISIPCTIAEGHARNSAKEYANIHSIAKGSNAEIQTQCLICVKLQYITEEEIEKVLFLSDEIGKILSSIIRRITP